MWHPTQKPRCSLDSWMQIMQTPFSTNSVIYMPTTIGTTRLRHLSISGSDRLTYLPTMWNGSLRSKRNRVLEWLVPEVSVSASFTAFWPSNRTHLFWVEHPNWPGKKLLGLLALTIALADFWNNTIMLWQNSVNLNQFQHECWRLNHRGQWKKNST